MTEALQTFEDLGFQVEVLDISACDRVAQAKIFPSKLLYLWCNTFYLLQELKKNASVPDKERVRMAWLCGRIAGAIITAKDIDYAVMDDKTG